MIGPRVSRSSRAAVENAPVLSTIAMRRATIYTHRMRSAPVACALLAAAFAVAPGCTCSDAAAPSGSVAPPLTAPFSDDFNRVALGPDWKPTDDTAYRIEGGELIVKQAYNHPMWLTRAIPRDALVEFDCWSNDDAGDLKVEVWGDGKSFATDRVGAYTSTAYNFIFGGWHNQLATLARMHEHGEDRLTRADVKVVKGKRYHWAIRRKGGHIEWTITDAASGTPVGSAPFFTLDDAQPLEGPGHAFFSFNDWEAELHFDNLKITPL